MHIVNFSKIKKVWIHNRVWSYHDYTSPLFPESESLNTCTQNIHFGRVAVWYGVNRMIIYFSKASIPLSSRYSIHPLFISSWWKIASAAKNWSDSVPQTAATTFAFSSVFIHLLCLCPGPIFCPPPPLGCRLISWSLSTAGVTQRLN